MRVASSVLFVASLILLVGTTWAQRPDEDRPRRGRNRDRDAQAEEGDRDGQRPERRRRAGGRERGPGEEGGRRGGRGGGNFMRMFPVMAALDADGDGNLSKSEIENATVALKKLDKDGDGQLTREEMMPQFGGPGGPRFGRPGFGFGGPRGGGRSPEEMVQTVMERDKNGDGKITKDEIAEGDFFGRVFDRADSNGDEALDKAEIEEFAKSMAERRGRRGFGGPNRPGRDDDRPRRPRRPE